VIHLLRDGLVSLATRLGTSTDKAETASYIPRLLTVQEIEDSFRSSWVMKKAVKIPALDATRKWRRWSDDRVSVQENQPRIQLRRRLYETTWKGRLYGGAGLLIGTDQDDMSQPVDVEGETLQYTACLTRLQLSAEQIEDDPRMEFFGRPRMYSVSTRSGLVRVHPTRIVLHMGEEAPDWLTARSMQVGWGDSLLQSIYDACRNLDSTMGNIAALVFDAKTDVVQIPGLTESITSAKYEEALLRRFSAARMLKGNHGTLLLDGEEEYSSKSYNFGGLDTIADRFMQVASGAADIPMTRLMGMSPAGMNSTGEGDLANYYDRIASMQSTELQPEMRILDALLARSAGVPQSEARYEWSPLHQMTEQQVAEIRSKNADTISKIASTRVYADDEVARIGSLIFRETGVEIDDTLPTPEDDPPQQPVRDATPRTLYVRRNVVNADEVLAWAREQGFGETLSADDLHVTIAFSRTLVDWMKTGQAWDDQMEIPAGGARLMERFGDARVLLFVSSGLSWRHEDIKSAGASWDHPEYQPHITISYSPDSPDLSDVEPYRGRIVLGPEIYEEVNEKWREKIGA
jgi:phage-related protein (TIGR01555 family)